MKIIDIDQNFIISIMSSDIAFNYLPELEPFKRHLENFKKVKNGEISCGSCTQNGLINPTNVQFLALLVQEYNTKNYKFIVNLKNWAREYFSISEDFLLKFAYQQNHISDVEEILI